MARSHLVSIISSHRSAAERDLMGAVGSGGSLCAIGRSGNSYPAVKYHEGAVAALAEAARSVSDVAALQRLVDRWRSPVTGPTASSPDWVAYRAGGAEALEAVLTESAR